MPLGDSGTSMYSRLTLGGDSTRCCFGPRGLGIAVYSVRSLRGSNRRSALLFPAQGGPDPLTGEGKVLQKNLDCPRGKPGSGPSERHFSAAPPSRGRAKDPRDHFRRLHRQLPPPGQLYPVGGGRRPVRARSVVQSIGWVFPTVRDYWIDVRVQGCLTLTDTDVWFRVDVFGKACAGASGGWHLKAGSRSARHFVKSVLISKQTPYSSLSLARGVLPHFVS